DGIRDFHVTGVQTCALPISTPVELTRNGLRTVALGVGDVSRIDLPFLPNSADIRVGDLLVSSGLGDAFPAGYPVARVTQIERRRSEERRVGQGGGSQRCA